MVKNLPVVQATRVPSLGQEDPMEEMTTHSENPMDRGFWRATVHGVAKSWTRLSNFHFTSNIVTICHTESYYSIINYIPYTVCYFIVTCLSQEFYTS